MIDDLIAIRLQDLCRIYQQARDWPAFRRAVIEAAAAVKIVDGKGHPEPKYPKPNGDGPTYA